MEKIIHSGVDHNGAKIYSAYDYNEEDICKFLASFGFKQCDINETCWKKGEEVAFVNPRIHDVQLMERRFGG